MIYFLITSDVNENNKDFIHHFDAHNLYFHPNRTRTNRQ